LLGFNIQISQYTYFNSPIISDVQDEAIRAELMKRGLKQRDAEHITQAVCNNCDVFLTRDKGIRKRRDWLEQRFPGLKIRLHPNWSQTYYRSDFPHGISRQTTVSNSPRVRWRFRLRAGRSRTTAARSRPPLRGR
jgi:hypothetical protein